MCIRPVKHCKIIVSSVRTLQPVYLPGDEIGFFSFIISSVIYQLVSFVLICPQLLGLTISVMTYYRMSRIKYIGSGSVILLKLYHFRIFKILFEFQYISDVRTSPLIDALVIVANHTYIIMRLRKHFYESVLYLICILIFINHNISETPLIFEQYSFILFKQSDSIKQQIVKIHGIVLLKGFLIPFIYTAYLSGFYIISVYSGVVLRR